MPAPEHEAAPGTRRITCRKEDIRYCGGIAYHGPVGKSLRRTVWGGEFANWVGRAFGSYEWTGEVTICYVETM